MIFITTVVIIVLILFMFCRKSKTSEINTLMKKSAEWATTAQQDSSPKSAMLHANYAVGYYRALKDIATDKEIHSATGVDIVKFGEHILNVQEMVTKKVVKECPEFEGHIDLYLSTISNM